MIDSGVVNVTAINDDKFSYMDRVTLTDATAEHTQILYPSLNDDETQVFAYTKYNIKSIEACIYLFLISPALLPSSEYLSLTALGRASSA